MLHCAEAARKCINAEIERLFVKDIRHHRMGAVKIVFGWASNVCLVWSLPTSFLHHHLFPQDLHPISLRWPCKNQGHRPKTC